MSVDGNTIRNSQNSLMTESSQSSSVFPIITSDSSLIPSSSHDRQQLQCCHAVITGLVAFTDYYVVVQAVNEEGAGPNSEPVQVKTLEDGE